MIEDLKSLFSQTSIYFIGNMSIKLISIILIPIYTKYITPGEYGVLEIAFTLSSFMLVILGFGFSSAIFREYFKEDSIEYKKTIIGTSFIFLFCINILILVPMLIFATDLSGMLIGGVKSKYLLYLVIADLFIQNLLSINYAILRANQKPVLFSFYKVITTFFYGAFNIYFIIELNRGFTGVREGILFSSLMAFILSLPVLIKNIKLKFSIPIFRRLLQFGVPLIYSGLATWILNLTDRYMLKFLLPEDIGMTQVGLYALGAKLSMVGRFIIVQPFMMAWGVAMYKIEKRKDAKQFFAAVFKYFVVVAAVYYLFMVIFGYDIIKLIARSSEYYDAHVLIKYLSLSGMFYGIYMIFTVGVTLTYKTKYMAYSTICAALLNIALNYLLIPQLFMVGAGIGSVVSMLFMTVVLYFISQKYYKIKYDVLLALLTLLGVIIIAFINHHYMIPFYKKIILFIVVSVVILRANKLTIKKIYDILVSFRKST